MDRVRWHAKEIDSLGFVSWLALRRTRRRVRTHDKGEMIPVRCPVKGLSARAQTSDLAVFYQIFVSREYRCLDHVKDVRLIIDCGANVGYSSAFFLDRHPHAKLIAVEPDPSNFQALSRNLQRFKDRVTLIQSGVWSKPTGLVIDDKVFGDGREWAVTVREAKPGERATMQAVSIGRLLEQSGHERISILKIDIEGSEAEVFRENCDWLHKVDYLVIELHGPQCDEALFKAISGLPAKVSRCEELTVCEFV